MPITVNKQISNVHCTIHELSLIYSIKFVCLSVCMRAMAGRTAGLIMTKLGMGTHVDPGSVLGKVKVKVMWRHLANANKTPYSRGPQGPTEFDKYGGQRPTGPRQQSAQRDKSLRLEDGYLQLVSNNKMLEDFRIKIHTCKTLV